MTRRQSNNQWSGGIVVYPAPRPQKFRVKKSTEKKKSLNFLDQDGFLLIDTLPKSLTINTEYY
jgi:hypothetical protein